MKVRQFPLLLAFAFLIFLSPAYAQEKTLVIEDAVTNRAVLPQSLRFLSWIGESDHFCYVKTPDQVLMPFATYAETEPSALHSRVRLSHFPPMSLNASVVPIAIAKSINAQNTRPVRNA